jgi:hypothetical protein
MDQVSRPMLIALAATVMLAAVWLIALRPKPPEVADTPLAPVTAVSKAREAAAASDAANSKLSGVSDQGAAANAPAPAAATPTAPAAAKPVTSGAPTDI